MSAIKEYLFPTLDQKVERIVDIDSIKNIYHLSLVIGLFELFTIPVFLYITPELGHDAHVSLTRVVVCVVLCVCGRLLSGLILKNDQVPHNAVLLFKVMYCLALSAWAVWVSYLHYIRGDQLFSFFAVELLIVCFISLRPWVSIVLTLAVYMDLYVILFVIDGADRVNILNYIVLVFSSIMGMIMRYHSQARLAQMTVSQAEHSVLLEHANCHDGLTNLRNRKALEEDVVKIAGRHVKVFMLDINYFKEINDTYGHIAGDEVLRATAVQLKKLFPESRCYRYGGDEFLVLRTDGNAYTHDFYSFHVPAVPGEKIVLSIGHAEGEPETHDQLFDLIRQADESLYESKRKTHSPEFGGHDRRRRRR